MFAIKMIRQQFVLITYECDVEKYKHQEHFHVAKTNDLENFIGDNKHGPKDDNDRCKNARIGHAHFVDSRLWFNRIHFVFQVK
jgi:hypothetical protein